MHPRKRSVVRPLLSVAAALSVAACGSTKVPVQPDPPTADASTAAPAGTLSTGVVVPRVLPSGSPACGNTTSKAPRPPECD